MFESDAIEMSEEFADLVFLAIDHGVDSVRAGGGPLIPFVMIEQAGKRELRRFVTDRLEEAQQRARDAVAALDSSATAYALAYDGYITLDEFRCDAILVEASERGRPAGVHMGQRYTVMERYEDLQTLGNPMLLGECETLLR